MVGEALNARGWDRGTLPELDFFDKKTAAVTFEAWHMDFAIFWTRWADLPAI